ncbi:hypothetical protein [Zavarzinella formosa]|uniref:hypothetical protein n=1 Tax=Zavarzinella formosa TaxID=360055 RepID=UPI0002E67AF1|nr:hypothetical protein [Zavarzinella formosa]
MTRQQEAELADVLRDNPQLAVNLVKAVHRFDCQFDFAEPIERSNEVTFLNLKEANAGREQVSRAMAAIMEEIS